MVDLTSLAVPVAGFDSLPVTDVSVDLVLVVSGVAEKALWFIVGALKSMMLVIRTSATVRIIFMVRCFIFNQLFAWLIHL